MHSIAVAILSSVRCIYCDKTTVNISKRNETGISLVFSFQWGLLRIVPFQSQYLPKVIHPRAKRVDFNQGFRMCSCSWPTIADWGVAKWRSSTRCKPPRAHGPRSLSGHSCEHSRCVEYLSTKSLCSCTVSLH